MALSPGDPSSYSRPDQLITKHIHLDLDINFEEKILSGFCVLSIEKEDISADTLTLDCRDLEIEWVKIECEDGDIPLDFVVDGKTSYGSCLQIKLAARPGMSFQIRIKYKTSPESGALQWLTPEQTAGKKMPYVFSQCQAILCRAMLPCQDTPSVKSTYTASITAPAGITVLMSAIRDPKPKTEGEKQRFTFKQPIPIQSYLIAIAAGALESKKIGPRTHVWSEKEFVEKAAFEFSETETMLAIAEELCGPYVWGEYDILVLPPSFPYGGMENPCLTFATPTLLSGDRENADVIAHEIAHSWTGNLVTNKTFEHFWLNEGFTVFVERKIKGRMHGEPFRHFSAILRWPDLEETINKVYGPDNPLTRLVPDLRGVNPEDAFSVVPYEKGSTFLWYLEDLVGGGTKFEPFLRAYYTAFSYKSIDSDAFKDFFLEYFSSVEAVKTINWDKWFYSPGMPPYKPKFDDSLAVVCQELADRWTSWNIDSECPFNGTELENFASDQTQAFLNSLLNGKPLAVGKLEKMEELYKLSESQNTEVVFRWIRVGIAARWGDIVPLAVKLVSEQGRMKFVRPIYRDLYAWPQQRKVALETFEEYKDGMMLVARDMVAKDLQINTNTPI